MTTNVPSQNQTFALAMFAGAAQSLTGPGLGATAYDLIRKALDRAKGDIGQWDVVWGPAVLETAGGTGSIANLIYAVQNHDDPSQYVIAIAGTNFNTALDSLVEDDLVFVQVPWVYSLEAQGAKISLGAAIGLLNLQTVTPEATVPGTGTTLMHFLRGIVKTKVSITVAGHSLGGALASVVALWLADTQQGLILPWDFFKNATIGAHTYAGPTAGNSVFANYVYRKLGDLLVPSYNSIDAIPHAWQETPTQNSQGANLPALSDLPGLYPEIAPPNADLTYLGVLVVTGLFRLLASGGDYAALPNIQAFQGQFVPGIYLGSKHDSFTAYLGEVGYQHINGYYSQFGYKKEWMSTVEPQVLSAELAALAQSSQSAQEFLTKLQARPRRQLSIGGTPVDAPTGPGDQQGQALATLVENALKQGGRS